MGKTGTEKDKGRAPPKSASQKTASGEKEPPPKEAGSRWDSITVSTLFYTEADFATAKKAS